MKFVCSLLFVAALAPAAVRGAELIANDSVATAALDKSALKDIFVGKTSYWEGGLAITIVVAADKTDDALQELTGMSASQFKTHWQRLAFSGRGKQPKFVEAGKLAATVAETKGAVAFSPEPAAAGVKKIEVK